MKVMRRFYPYYENTPISPAFEAKGSLTRDFRLQVFFMNQCTRGPQVSRWGRFEFFR
jgi:hypothetical protein